MYSLLDELDKYLKENNISIDNDKFISFGYECLPEYINQAILYATRQMDNDSEFSFGLEEYCLKYSREGKLYIHIANDSKNKCMLIFKDLKDAYIVPENEYISERRILEFAYLLEQNRLKQLELRDLISIKYPNIDRLKRLKIEYKIMYCMLTEQIDEAYQTGKDILENVDIQAWLSDSFKKITADILKYIHDEDETKKYIDVVQKNQNDKQKNDEDDMLVYTPRSDTGSKKVNRGNVVTNVRVNNIISLDERKNILEAHNPIFRRKARQTETKEATDLYYLYRINNKVYMVIIEPTSGESYTKMIGVYDRWFLDKKEFDGFVEGYLQMTEKEMLASDEIVRTSHTTLETFKEIIDYALTGESHIYGGFHAKRKIKRLRTYPDKRG